ncbi:hypothetical protein SPHINGO8AM_80021 [Sphingomonas sp. 8AM]|nr:hypothetical protein SPHINGO8AM_80021 [Sphingomonas sp. 8AM]
MVACRVDDRRRGASRPAILVVIPYYNAEAWIAPCLEALGRSDIAHDILIIDDGSDVVVNPGSPADNLVICRFEQNAGLITALNFAASFALEQGYAFFVRQDADDLSRPARLRRQWEAMEAEQADLVVSGVHAVDEVGETIWSGAIQVDPAGLRRLLASRNPVVHSTWFMRTSLFRTIGCYDERFKGAEDFELLQRIFRQGSVAIVPEELVDYLVRSGSILSGSRGPAAQTVRVLARHFDPASPQAYVGIARAAAAVLASRHLKTMVRRFIEKHRR